jgi:hypothetical protein
MNSKLTLTVDKSVIEEAKKYAESTGTSLSNLVENYLKSFSKKPATTKKDELSPLIKSLKGAFNAPCNFDYKEELESELSKKYRL